MRIAMKTASYKNVHAPASKSMSHRMLMGAALANGESVVNNVLESQDLMQTMAILEAAGARFEKVEQGVYKVQGSAMQGKKDFNDPLSCDVHESGTTCRLLTAILASGEGYFYVHGAERMHERPIGTLTATLEQLGAKFRFQNEGYPPFILFANGLNGGEITISLEESSQYLSGLLLAAPLAKEPITIYIGGRHVVSWPYIGLTLQAMKAFGAQFDVCLLDKDKSTAENKVWKLIDWKSVSEVVPGEIRFRVRPFRAEEGNKPAYKAGTYYVEGDWSGASYLLAAGAVGKNPVCVHGLNRLSLQADKALLDILISMKAKIEYGVASDPSIIVHPSHLQGVEVNMADCPDIVPTVAVLAAFAHGTTKITGVEHLRIKECDRLNAMAEELKKAGVDVIEEQDGLIIKGLHPHKPQSQAEMVAREHGYIQDAPKETEEEGVAVSNSQEHIENPSTNVSTEENIQQDNAEQKFVSVSENCFQGKEFQFKSYGDHRIVMSLSLLQLAGAKVDFDDKMVITKSFPNFWNVWKVICE